jgi:hypothetical protein
MKLQIVEEPQLAFHQGKLHVDIRAGLSAFGAFTKAPPEFQFQFESV